MGMATKLALACSVGLAFPLLDWLGFDPDTPNASGKDALVFLYALLPIGLNVSPLYYLEFSLRPKETRNYKTPALWHFQLNYFHLFLISFFVIEKKNSIRHQAQCFHYKSKPFGNTISNLQSSISRKIRSAASFAVIMKGISKSF